MARYLGIEVSESMLRGALLRTAYKKLVLEGVFAVYRAPGPEGLTQAARDLATTVQQALATPGGRAAELDGIYAALPGTEVSLRTVSLPRAVHRRGDKGLMAELEGAVPFNIDDALIDAQVIRAGETMELLAAAVMTARVESFVHALAAGGLDPREVGVGPVALGELAAEVPELAAPGPVLLVHASERRAEFLVLRDGVVQFARTVSGLNTPAARERTMRQSLAAWQSSGGAPPAVAYVAGEEGAVMVEPLVTATGLTQERVTWMPSGAIETSPTASQTALWEAPVAVALAARGLGRSRRMDFRKGPLAVAGGAQVLRERAPYLLAAVGAILCFWSVATYARYQGLVAERARLQETLARVTHEAFGETVTDPDRAMNLARGEGVAEDLDPMPGADAYDVIGVLAQRISPDVRHDIEQLDIRGEHVQVQGIVDTLADRDKVVEALSAYPCFPSVRPGRSTTSPGDNRQKYTLDVEFRCPEAHRAGTRARTGTGAAGENTRDRDNGSGTNAGGRRGSSS